MIAYLYRLGHRITALIKREHMLNASIALLLFGAAAALRAISSTPFVTWDEPAWVYRSTKFLLAISRGEFADTLQTGHPGVITMWTGALSLVWHRWVSGAITAQQIASVDAMTEFMVHDVALLRLLGQMLPYAKQGLMLFHGVVAVILYFLFLDLADRGIALVVSLMLLLDPWFLGLSRVMHIDAVSSELMLVAVLAAIRQRKSRRGWLLCGVSLAMAFLAKTYGGFAAPVVAVVLLWPGSGLGAATDTRWSERVKQVARVAGVAIVVTFALWPAMWVSLGEVARTVIGLSIEYASDAGDANTSFFLGRLVQDPGALFYPVALAWRAMPLTLVGLVLAVMVAISRRLGRSAHEGQLPERWLLLLAACFVFFISLSEKKFDRYALVIHLTLVVIAAQGLVLAVRWLLSRIPHKSLRRATPVVVALLLLSQAVTLVAPLYPAHLLAFYSPLLGGAARAVDALPVGWGEGIELGARWLAELPDNQDLTVASWAVAGLAPFFPGDLVVPTPENLARADYVLRYVADGQGKDPAETSTEGLVLERVFRVNGADYVWLYGNVYDETIWARLAGEDMADAVIVTSAPTKLDADERHSLPIVSLSGLTEVEIGEELQAFLAQGIERIYYVAIEGDAHRLELIRRQLDQNGYLLWQEPITLGVMARYELAENAQFGPVSVSESAPVSFGSPAALTLNAYGLASDTVAHRRQIGLALRWRSHLPMAENYHVSVRLVDGQGRVWGQRDLPLVDDGWLRTSDWTPESEHTTIVGLSVPVATTPGAYWLRVEVYSLATLQTLGRIGKGGSPTSAPLLLGPVTVAPDRWPPDVAGLDLPNALRAGLAPGAELVGYTLSSRSVSSGEALDLQLYWHCLASMAAPYAVRIDLGPLGAGQSWTAQPAGDGYPTDSWLTGEILRYPHPFHVSPELPGGTYQLSVGLVDERGQVVGDRAELGRVNVTHLERLFVAPAMAHQQPTTFGDQIRLLGYAFEPMAAGDSLGLTLYWQAMRAPRVDYTVFVHLLAADGEIIAQVDAQPQSGGRPTSGWLPHEVIIDSYELLLDEPASSGQLRVAVGFYDRLTGDRLQAMDAAGASIPDGRVLLATSPD